MHNFAPSSGRSKTALRPWSGLQLISRQSLLVRSMSSARPTLGGSDMHDSPTVVLLAMIIVGLPTVMLMLIFNRFFKLREKKLDVEAGMAAEKAAQYAARTHELEDRVRVLEQIVTDRGVQTAAQIEALRVHTTDRPRKSSARTAG